MSLQKAILYCFLLIAAPCAAQLNYEFTQGKFLIKGTVIDVQKKTPVPAVNVRITNTTKGTSADADGNFMLYVSKRDTLKFSCTGYISKVIHVADLDSTRYYLVQVELLQDFIRLKEVTVYPFRDLDDFKEKFKTTKVDPLVIAGIAPPKYSNHIPKAKLTNPVSFIYERLKSRKRKADPDFKP